MKLCLLVAVLLVTVTVVSCGNVSYDGRSLIIDGQRKLLISASIHYPRSVPAMWPGLVQTAKEGGVDVIETYVFWNGHELSPGNYYFGGRFDLVKFARTVHQAGMFLILRIGPFVAAEWNFGGVPVWLHYVPGTVFRTYNQPFMYHMQKFTTYIVNLMKQEKLFASQGGPIILAQIENEYGYYENFYKEDGKKYALWAAKMAVSQNTGVPWIMCQQWDAPDPVIDTCNSFYCDQFKPTSPNRPKIWTENWPGWFKTFGGRDPHRPAEDVAFSVARFFQKGGSVHNYYMYHGGTNFGRTAGGPFITTSYDYDAPIDEYGLPRLPKWGHLKELHRAIKLCEHVLLNGKPVNISLGPFVEADVYTDSSGACAAFISNSDDKNDRTVEFRNTSYQLPAWSVSILPDCKNVVFNTAKVNSQTNVVAMIPGSLQHSNKGVNSLRWDIVKEKPGIWGTADFVKNGFVDLINTTKDTTDYLWHTTSIFVGENEEFLKKGSKPVLLIESTGHALHAFVNQEYQGTGTGNGTHSPFTFKNPISLRAGKNEIALLCLTVGLQTAGPFYDFVGAGLTSVKIKGLNNGTIDLSSYAWTYKIGVQGEHLKLYQGNGLNNVSWTSTSEPPKMQPLTWYKTIVDAPPGDEPVGLDMLHMGKGLAWLNGEEIGRYWPRKSEFKSEDCVKECDYRGKFNPDKCDTGCGEPTQRWYHVPRSWFKPSGNVLVLFEEKGGEPDKIRFVRRKISGACALVSEDYPSVGLLSQGEDKVQNNKNIPFARLTCPSNTHISAVKFASFGSHTRQRIKKKKKVKEKEMEASVPVVDFQKLSEGEEWKKLKEACEKCGIFRVINHPISETLMKEMKSAVKFWHDLPLEIKMRNKSIIPDSGYIPPFPSSPLYEAMVYDFHKSPQALDDFFSQLDLPPYYRKIVKTYGQAIHDLASTIAQKMAKCLGIVDVDFKDWPFLLRTIKYNFSPENIGEMGILLHSDTGFITLLQDDETVTGLELLDDSGILKVVTPKSGSFLCIVGDVGHVWSNEKFWNARHRVICKETCTRYSFGVFMLAARDGIVEAHPKLAELDNGPRYQPFKYEDLREFRIVTGKRNAEVLDQYRIA